MVPSSIFKAITPLHSPVNGDVSKNKRKKKTKKRNDKSNIKKKWIRGTFVHDQIQGKVLDKEVTVVAHCLAIKSVEQSMAGPVCHCTASVCLASYCDFMHSIKEKKKGKGRETSSPIIALSSKCSLINFSILSSRKRHAIMFKLNDCCWCFSTHVLNGVLITFVSFAQFICF